MPLTKLRATLLAVPMIAALAIGAGQPEDPQRPQAAREDPQAAAKARRIKIVELQLELEVLKDRREAKKAFYRKLVPGLEEYEAMLAERPDTP